MQSQQFDSDNKNGTRGMPRGAARKIHCLSAKTCCENANSVDGLDAHDRVSFAVFGKKLFIVKCCLLSAPEPGGIIPNLFWHETLLRVVCAKCGRYGNSSWKTIGTLATNGVPKPATPPFATNGECYLLYIQKSKKLPEYFGLALGLHVSCTAPTQLTITHCSQGNVCNSAAAAAMTCHCRLHHNDERKKQLMEITEPA